MACPLSSLLWQVCLEGAAAHESLLSVVGQAGLAAGSTCFVSDLETGGDRVNRLFAKKEGGL